MREPRCLTSNPASTRQLHYDWVASLTDDELEQGSDLWPREHGVGKGFKDTFLERPEDLLEIIYDAEDCTTPTVGNEVDDPPPEEDEWGWLGMWGVP